MHLLSVTSLAFLLLAIFASSTLSLPNHFDLRASIITPSDQVSSSSAPPASSGSASGSAPPPAASGNSSAAQPSGNQTSVAPSSTGPLPTAAIPTTVPGAGQESGANVPVPSSGGGSGGQFGPGDGYIAGAAPGVRIPTMWKGQTVTTMFGIGAGALVILGSVGLVTL